MVFGCRTEDFSFRAGDTVDLVYSMEINEFRGERSAQMLVSDLHAADGHPAHELCQNRVYAQILENIPVLPEGCTTAAQLIPGREDCRAVWLYLREQTGGGTSPAVLSWRRMAFHTGIGMCRVRLICDMFAQTGLLLCEKPNDEGFRCTLTAAPGVKIDLTAAPLYQKLRRLFGL